MDTVAVITESLGRNFTYEYAKLVKTSGLSLLQESIKDYPTSEDVKTGMTYIPVDILTGQFHMSYYTAERHAQDDIARIARAARAEQVADRAPLLV